MSRPIWPSPGTIGEFTYSKLSHFRLFDGLPFRSFNSGKADPAIDNLKVYQDYLAYCYIRKNIPQGARILEIGGGDSRVLRHFAHEYECWNLDKFEGLGNGPTQAVAGDCRLVRDYLGNFNAELPESYFDLVFSISALEHTPEDPAMRANLLADLNRVLKPGCPSFHLFDIVIHPDGSAWINGLIPYLAANVPLLAGFPTPQAIQADPDTYYMPEAAYNLYWLPAVKQPYRTYGRPLSTTLLWHREPTPKPTTPAGASQPASTSALSPPVAMINSSWPSHQNIADFSYSKRSHFELFRGLPFQSYNVGDPDPAICDLKVYQDYMTYCFIRNNIAPGSKILEVGGGDSRILKFFSKDYECWNADKCEGLGNGPVKFTSPHYRIVYDYVGSFNSQLPTAYFDFVFSISALEHTPEDPGIRVNVIKDMNRVLKPGCPSFHCFDSILRAEGKSWVNGLIPYIYANTPTLTNFTPMAEIERDSDTYAMSRAAYEANWQPITKDPYEAFGRAFSYNLCWLAPVTANQ